MARAPIEVANLQRDKADIENALKKYGRRGPRLSYKAGRPQIEDAWEEVPLDEWVELAAKYGPGGSEPP